MSKRAAMKTSEREMSYRKRKTVGPLQALTKAQGEYINAILANTLKGRLIFDEKVMRVIEVGCESSCLDIFYK